ncbi:putative phosphoglycerate mutase [Orbus hercynius]|uniref:Putative phosphoglycerate mutase n=1 Tax=Orbus hercynius TaxID=593135 RepID=A0A495RJ41_9GAMM|nr:histidine phosphatase family protein [Orbus hercynius]RKS87176.1 putative phosphoglycerate mutase [Orbus hercynius]
MKNLNLYLIRHGQTEWNIADRMQGSKNSPLTAQGVLGAKITGQYLQDTPFIAAYSSPQQRAVETRDYILSVRNDIVPAKTSDGLREMDFGLWEGKPITELRQLPEFSDYMHKPAEFDSATNKGENYLAVLNRMKSSLDEIVSKAVQDTGNILIVSHGTALRLLLCVLNGGHWHDHRDDSYFPRILNTSISRVNYQGDGKTGNYRVDYFNNIDHLPK